MQVTVTKALLVILTQFNKCCRIDVHDRIMVNHSSGFSVEYYKQYNIDIKDPKQPMLISQEEYCGESSRVMKDMWEVTNIYQQVAVTKSLAVDHCLGLLRRMK